MYRLQRLIALVLFASAVFYIACSVASASFNLFNWTPDTRALGAFFWVFAVVVITAISLIPDDLKK